MKHGMIAILTLAHSISAQADCNVQYRNDDGTVTFKTACFMYDGNEYLLAPASETAQGFCVLKGFQSSSSTTTDPYFNGFGTEVSLDSSGMFVGLSNYYTARYLSVTCANGPHD